MRSESQDCKSFFARGLLSTQARTRERKLLSRWKEEARGDSFVALSSKLYHLKSSGDQPSRKLAARGAQKVRNAADLNFMAYEAALGRPAAFARHLDELGLKVTGHHAVAPKNVHGNRRRRGHRKDVNEDCESDDLQSQVQLISPRRRRVRRRYQRPRISSSSSSSSSGGSDSSSTDETTPVLQVREDESARSGATATATMSEVGMAGSLRELLARPGTTLPDGSFTPSTSKAVAQGLIQWEVQNEVHRQTGLGRTPTRPNPLLISNFSITKGTGNVLRTTIVDKRLLLGLYSKRVVLPDSLSTLPLPTSVPKEVAAASAAAAVVAVESESESSPHDDSSAAGIAL